MRNIDAKYLGRKEAAAYLGKAPITIDRWQEDPEVGFPRPSIINGRRYYSRDDIDEFMRSRAKVKAA